MSLCVKCELTSHTFRFVPLYPRLHVDLSISVITYQVCVNTATKELPWKHFGIHCTADFPLPQNISWIISVTESDMKWTPAHMQVLFWYQGLALLPLWKPPLFRDLPFAGFACRWDGGGFWRAGGRDAHWEGGRNLETQHKRLRGQFFSRPGIACEKFGVKMQNTEYFITRTGNLSFLILVGSC